MRPESYHPQDGCWNCKYVENFGCDGPEYWCGVDGTEPPEWKGFRDETDEEIRAKIDHENAHAVEGYGICKEHERR